MKFATALLMTIGVAAAGRLENVYLPPGSAGSAGGAAFVRAPGSGGSFNNGAGAGSGFSSYHASAGSVNGAYQGQASAYQGQNSGVYQGQTSGSYQGQSGSYQGQSGSYQGQSGSYQSQNGYRGQQYAITQYNNQNNGDGSYQYNYETENGINAQEAGSLQGDAQAVSGSYSYTGPDGVQYTIRYTAGPDGFHAEGAHIPTPPPISEEIRRGVELSLAAEARGENQDGQYRGEHQQAYNKYQGGSGVGIGSGSLNKPGYSY